MKIEKINNIKVKPIPIKGKYKWIGDLFNYEFNNTFLVTKKNSGKTSTIFEILKQYIDHYDKISTKYKEYCPILIIFCSTVFKDNNWLYMQQYFDGKVPIICYTSIYDENNVLETTIKEISQEKSVAALKLFSTLAGEQIKERVIEPLSAWKNVVIPLLNSSFSAIDWYLKPYISERCLAVRLCLVSK